MKEHTKIVELLIKAGANIDLQDSRGRTALYIASLIGHTGIVELLIKAGANIDLQDSRGRTAFDRAKTRRNERDYGNVTECS